MFTKLVVFCFLILSANAITGEDRQYWEKQSFDDLNEALKIAHNEGIAKNVILFVGDGMGPATVTATRVHHETEAGKLSFEHFPHLGLLKTYCADKTVPDSASTATALMSGVKVNMKTAGVDTSVKLGDCAKSLDKSTHLTSIVDWAQEAGKATGLVTTTRITHATPMALYAHAADRTWECEAFIPEKDRNQCKDIARQLVEDEPGKNINVIMGGGLQCMQSNVSDKADDLVDKYACASKDGRDLLSDWAKDKKARNLKHSMATNNKEFKNVDIGNTDYLLGVFANSHLPYEHLRNKDDNGSPSLSEMVEVAIKILQKNSTGYVLLVEGGLIDVGHHRGHARIALNEAKELSKAVKLAQTLTSKQAHETLIIVTADHAHGLTISGYPDRGTGMLGIGLNSRVDSVPITTLSYGTGGRNNYQYSVVDGKVERKAPLENETGTWEYSQQSGVLNNEVTHGGTDVYAFAIGPMAHLFHSVHEQTYVARVIAYAAKIGPHKDAASGSSNLSNFLLITFMIPFLGMYII